MEKMVINDRKILRAIDINLPNGRFVIFPYGKWGKRVQYLLNKKYGIQEIAIVDNGLAQEGGGILGINDTGKIGDSGYVVLFAVDNMDVYSELLEQTHCFGENPVCNIAAMESGDEFFAMDSDRLCIEECDSRQLETIFEVTRQTWSQLGTAQPYWSVLTDRKYLLENMGETEKKEFYGSGRKNCEAIVQTLVRNGIIKNRDEAKSLDITEIGCGTGRVTMHLAQTFRSVTALDISAGNMEIASTVVQGGNTSFRLVQGIEDYGRLPRADVVYSIMVLQHNVPPVIEYILNAMLESLKDGGTAIFQVPTYREAYGFCFDGYMSDSSIGRMEMHLLPQKRIFEIAHKNGCIPMEVYQDGLSGQDDFSCTFVMRKLGAGEK
ncbi:MAG: class I SAM-dependent methyltransferase [Lachnospiraceae bacterium]|nr:class I SAM-dependent methyltransferase [Lachnospiraceae bacterium]